MSLAKLYKNQSLELYAAEQCLIEMEALISYFAMTNEKQILLLPNLTEKRSYDLGGDLVTDNSLLVLASSYDYHLNQLLTKLPMAPDTAEIIEFNEIGSGICWAIDRMSNADLIGDFRPEVLDTASWAVVRHLSRSIKKIASIANIPTQADLWKYLDATTEADFLRNTLQSS